MIFKYKAKKEGKAEYTIEPHPVATEPLMLIITNRIILSPCGGKWYIIKARADENHVTHAREFIIDTDMWENPAYGVFVLKDKNVETTASIPPSKMLATYRTRPMQKLRVQIDSIVYNVYYINNLMDVSSATVSVDLYNARRMLIRNDKIFSVLPRAMYIASPGHTLIVMRVLLTDVSGMHNVFVLKENARAYFRLLDFKENIKNADDIYMHNRLAFSALYENSTDCFYKLVEKLK